VKRKTINQLSRRKAVENFSRGFLFSTEKGSEKENLIASEKSLVQLRRRGGEDKQRGRKYGIR
jgi:hypothetical protein